jgi:hypothetical protein
VARFLSGQLFDEAYPGKAPTGGYRSRHA